jgi:hypothetical protein
LWDDQKKRWFFQLLEDEEELERNSKGKDWRLFIHNLSQNLLLEEEKRYAGVILID